MFDKQFSFESFRKYAAIFGNLFNSIKVNRRDKDGTIVQTIAVPIEYGPRRKTLERIIADPNFTRPATILPRMSFEFTGLMREPERQLNKMNKRLNKSEASDDALIRQYQPVPYAIGVQLSIYSKTAYDVFQIIERILPFFQPEWNVGVRMVPETDKVDNIRIVLNSIEQNDTYEGDMTARRMIIWTLSFTMHGYFYPDVTTAGLIKKVILTFYPVPGSGEITAAEMERTPAAERYTLTPGLTADGLPTSDPELTIPYNQININDDYGLIEMWEDFDSDEALYTSRSYVVQPEPGTGETGPPIYVSGPKTYIPVTGGNVSGYLSLHDDPNLPEHPVTKRYLDEEAVNRDAVRVQTVTSSGSTLNINLDLGQYVILNLYHDISTIAISGWASGVISRCTLDIRYQGNVEIISWGSVLWADAGATPPLTGTTGTRDVIDLYSPDAGSTIFGNAIGLNYTAA